MATWLDRLLGRKPKEEQDTDALLQDLRVTAERVNRRTERLERELLRVNSELRRRLPVPPSGR